MSKSVRLLALLLLLALPAMAATTITGTVTNRTVNHPSAGDTVTLIRLAQGMQEATHTTTDGKGHFSLDVPDPGIHLVRVTHDKANYFQPAPPGTTNLDIDVYNAAAKVPGVALEADVFRIQTESDGKSLRVVQHFFLKNDSTPPRTQFGERAFEFTLPDGAAVEGAVAQGPGGMAVQSQPVPLPEKGHYSFIFPIRPGGETQFQISYRLPYNGNFSFSPSAAMATDNLVVMMPKAMHFDAGTTPFASVQDEVDAQTFVAKNIGAGKPGSFVVSGQGQLPRQTQQTQQGAGAQGGPAQGGGAEAGSAPTAEGASNTADTRPGGGLGNPINTPDPLSKYKWWIIAGVGLALAAGAGVLLSRPAPQNAIGSVAPEGANPSTLAPANTTLAALRDELFTLESDRLTGRISQDDYNRVKPALETVLQYALQRASDPIRKV